MPCHTVETIIEQEIKNEDAWDQLEGCRRGKHAHLEHEEESKAKFERTGGIQGWLTHTNFIVSLEEVVHYETPTVVILSLISLLKSQRAYAERITAIGYDMAGTLLGRAKTFVEKKLISEEKASILIKIISILFIDKWHVKGHKKDLCNQGKNGLLHPYLDRYKNILWGKATKTNDQVVEQIWKTINKLRFAKNLTRRKFRFTLIQFRKMHNDKIRTNLLAKGYEFVDIEKLSKVRNFDEIESEFPSMQQLLSDAKCQQLSMPAFAE